MFREFQNELHKCLTYGIERTHCHGDNTIYMLSYRGISLDTALKRPRSVTFNSETNIAFCSCSKFEFEGILCAHILRVFYMLNINELPDYYILDRWKKGSRRGIVLDAYGIEICEDHRKALVGRNGKALDAFLISGFYELSSESIEDQEVGLHLLEEWRLKFKDHLSKNTSNQSAKKHHHDPPESLEFVEPDHARHKGCGKRLKSSIEKATSLNRICSVCKGNDHDKRNCPKFASGKCKEAQVLNKAQNS